MQNKIQIGILFLLHLIVGEAFKMNCIFLENCPLGDSVSPCNFIFLSIFFLPLLQHIPLQNAILFDRS